MDLLRQITHLHLFKGAKILVGAVTCLEIITFAQSMSILLRGLISGWARPIDKWTFFPLEFAIVGLYMALPLAMGLFLARSKLRPGDHSLLWAAVILPLKVLSLAALILIFEGHFEVMMAASGVSLVAFTAFYVYAFWLKRAGFVSKPSSGTKVGQGELKKGDSLKIDGFVEIQLEARELTVEKTAKKIATRA